MGKPGSSTERQNTKRPRDRDPAEKQDDGKTKRLLAANKFAPLANQDSETSEKKEKLPPFYVKGFPPGKGLRQHINELNSKGLKATLRLCTDGYKIIVPSTPHYNAVKEYLKQTQAEYFTHDIAANKPFKVVLRGLPDMETSELQQQLESLGLKVEAIHKMTRHNKSVKYRDQLYLLHLSKGSTTLNEVKTITALFHIIVQWERYKPVHREVTQCGNCLNFGHGTKNCHLKSRCSKCGTDHPTTSCIQAETNSPCVNCGDQHSSTSRSCPKRDEFIKFRKKISQRSSSKSKPQDTIQVVADGLSNPPPPPTRSTINQSPPGFLSYAQVAASPSANSLYSMEQLAFLLTELDRQTKACRTNQEQIAVMMTFYYRHGSILANP